MADVTQHVEEQAIALLQDVLLESSMENEFDQDIYQFLKEQNALPLGYVPYWLAFEQEPQL